MTIMQGTIVYLSRPDAIWWRAGTMGLQIRSPANYSKGFSVA